MTSTFNGVPLSTLLNLPEVAAIAEEGQTVMWGSFVCPEDEVVVQFWPLLSNGSSDFANEADARQYRVAAKSWALSGSIPMRIKLKGPQPDRAHFSQVVVPFRAADKQRGVEKYPHEGHYFINQELCSGTYEGKWSTDPISSTIMLRTWLIQTLSHGVGVQSSARGWWEKWQREFELAYPLPRVTVIPTEVGGEEVAATHPMSPDMVGKYVRRENLGEVWRPRSGVLAG